MNSQPENANVTAHGEHVLRRIQWLTLAYGAAVATAAVALHRTNWAKGLLCGAVLAWLNFRWLRTGIRGIFDTALAQAKVQERTIPEGGEPSASSSNSATSGMLRAFSLLLRYALVALAVYAIFIYLHVPLVSIGLGLCALIAAIITASVWEALRPET